MKHAKSDKTKLLRLIPSEKITSVPFALPVSVLHVASFPLPTIPRLHLVVLRSRPSLANPIRHLLPREAQQPARIRHTKLTEPLALRHLLQRRAQAVDVARTIAPVACERVAVGGMADDALV